MLVAEVYEQQFGAVFKEVFARSGIITYAEDGVTAVREFFVEKAVEDHFKIITIALVVEGNKHKYFQVGRARC